MGYTELLPFRHGRARTLLTLKADNYIGRTVKLFGEYSESEVDVFRRFIQPDSICVDAGALFGEHTLAMAGLCPDGLVLAFEPQRIPFQMLCGSLQLNSISNVDAYKSALGREDGMAGIIPLDPRYENPWGLARVGAAGTELVRVRALDDLKIPRLDFVKLDVEGSEADVLAGARATIRRTRPVLYIEFNENRGAILNELDALGYSSPGQVGYCSTATAVFRHLAPVDREPNFLGRSLAHPAVGELMRPSDMILALPPERFLLTPERGEPRVLTGPAGSYEELRDWLVHNGFVVPLEAK